MHGGHVTSYEDVAAYFDVRICPEVGYGGCLVATVGEHRRGVAPPRERVIHWSPRRFNRLGFRRFLKLIAHVRIQGFYAMNPAMRIYAESTWAQRAAALLHVRFPTHYSDADRRRVRWYMSQGHGVSVQAKRWAERMKGTAS